MAVPLTVREQPDGTFHHSLHPNSTVGEGAEPASGTAAIPEGSDPPLEGDPGGAGKDVAWKSAIASPMIRIGSGWPRRGTAWKSAFSAFLPNASSTMGKDPTGQSDDETGTASPSRAPILSSADVSGDLVRKVTTCPCFVRIAIRRCQGTRNPAEFLDSSICPANHVRQLSSYRKRIESIPRPPQAFHVLVIEIGLLGELLVSLEPPPLRHCLFGRRELR